MLLKLGLPGLQRIPKRIKFGPLRLQGISNRIKFGAPAFQFRLAGFHFLSFPHQLDFSSGGSRLLLEKTLLPAIKFILLPFKLIGKRLLLFDYAAIKFFPFGLPGGQIGLHLFDRFGLPLKLIGAPGEFVPGLARLAAIVGRLRGNMPQLIG